MATKTTGTEWKRFYTDPSAWPEGTWHDDAEITIDGVVAGDDIDLGAVDDGAVMSVSGGVVFLGADDRDGPTLEAYFKRWRKAQNTVVLACECPRELVAAVENAIRKAGGKVIK